MIPCASGDLAGNPDFFAIIRVTDFFHGSHNHPFQAVAEKSTYLGKVYGYLEINYKGKVYFEETEKGSGIPKISHLMDLPAITGSILDASILPEHRSLKFQKGDCPLMPCGVTIINGATQHVRLQTKLRNNTVMLYVDTDDKRVTCNTTFMDQFGKCSKIIIYDVPVQSKSSDESLKDQVSIHIPFLGADGKKKTKIPLFHVFPHLGVNSTEEIKELILKFVKDDERDAVMTAMEKNEAVNTVTSSAMIVKKQHLKDSVSNQIFSEIYPITTEIEQKAEMLAYMASRMFLYKAGYRKSDKRDNVGFTRFETPEVLLMKFCATNLKDILESVRLTPPSSTDIGSGFKSYIDKNRQKCFSQISAIGSKIIATFRKGSWNVKSAKNNTSEGLSEILKPESILENQSTMSRNTSASGKQGLQKDTRLAGPTQSHVNDMKDSNEGDGIGLNRHLTMVSHISANRDPFPVMQIIRDELSTPFCNEKGELCPHPVLLNGVIIGWTEGVDFVAEMKEHRLKGGALRDHYDMMLFFDPIDNEVVIDTTCGRATHVMLVATDDGSDVLYQGEDMSVEEMLDLGYIQYVDTYEEERACLVATSVDEQSAKWSEIRCLETEGNYEKGLAIRNNFIYTENKRPPRTPEELVDLIAKRKRDYRFTHVEVGKSSGDGYAGSQVPGCNHTLGSKASYSCKISRQTTSPNNTNQPLQLTTISKLSLYTSRGTTETVQTKNVGLEQLPHGQNITVSFNLGSGNDIYCGYNQEDSDELARGARDRGIFDYYSMKHKKYEHPNGDRDAVVIELPKVLTSQHNLLDDRGIIKTGSFVTRGSILVARSVKVDGKYVSDDFKLDDMEKGIVESVIVSKSGGIYVRISFKIREYRQFKKGSKKSTRYGNKGVLGSVTETRNLPRTSSGLSPVLTLSPLGFISRQTWPFFREMMMSSVGDYVGKRQNGTSFCDDFELEKFEDMLLKLGEGNRHGACQMYNGKTGLPLPDLVYSGSVYVLPLHHTPEEKANYRGKSPQNMIDNQTNKGRKDGGNSRFGGMESATINSSGAAALHHEIFAYDNLPCPFCSTCGMIAGCNMNGVFRCNICTAKKREHIVYRCNISGAHRHLIHQLMIQSMTMRMFPVPL